MPPPLCAAVMYAQDPVRVAAFYEALTPLKTTHVEASHRVLQADGSELVIHALPPEVAGAITITQPPQMREDTPIKLVFEVVSIATARRVAGALGGQVLPAEREWTWGDWRVCDAIDPEGNVLQLRQRLRGAVADPAPPLRLISSMATKALLADLLARCAAQPQGQAVQSEAVGGVDAAKRVAAGEALDVVVLARDAIDQLVASGHLLADSVVDVVDSRVAVAVRAGDAAPDISTETALRDAVLAARSIGYSTGPSGTALAKLFERWGVADVVKAKLVVPPPGVPVGRLIANGEVALGFQQLSELRGVSGITVIGSLPPAVQIVTTFSGAVAAASRSREAAQAVLAFMASDEVAALKRQHGMTPPEA